MKIGIDARPTQGEFTGDATYWRGLIHGLSGLEIEDEIILYFDPRLPHPQLNMVRPFTMRYVQAMNWRMWSIFAFPRALKKDRVDLAHVQYSLPPVLPCTMLTSIHDVSFKRHPEFFAWKDRIILDAAVKRAGNRAARILTLSEYQKNEITDLYGISADKIAVIPLAAEEQFQPVDRAAAKRELAEKYGIKSEFILSVGVIQPRKNLPRLLEGYAGLSPQLRATTKLVIVGKRGWLESEFPRKIEELGLSEGVVLPGYVPLDDLQTFYNAAELFVYPSVYEGFGLPPLEAMACGTPAITGNQSSLPEVVGDAGLMVDPYDSNAFTKAITMVLTDESLRTKMSAMGLKQAAKFSWARTAERVLEIYHEARSE
jgi:glycosyltransferase involved in cell wall biosynthesis